MYRYLTFLFFICKFKKINTNQFFRVMCLTFKKVDARRITSKIK